MVLSDKSRDAKHNSRRGTKPEEGPKPLHPGKECGARVTDSEALAAPPDLTSEHPPSSQTALDAVWFGFESRRCGRGGWLAAVRSSIPGPHPQAPWHPQL